jgi:hypothetical protein
MLAQVPTRSGLLLERASIWASKFAEEQPRCFVICCRGELGRVETSKVVLFFSSFYIGPPASAELSHAFETAVVGSWNLAILHVLTACCQPQVASAIIESVAIDVIHFPVSWSIHHNSVHIG